MKTFWKTPELIFPTIRRDRCLCSQNDDQKVLHMLGFRDGSGTSTSVLIATFQKGRIAQASCQVAFFGYV